MADQINIAYHTDQESGITYEIRLFDAYVNYGGQVEVTPIKNYGTENEIRLPTTRSSEATNLNTALTDEQVATLGEANPLFSQFVPMIVENAINPYKQ